MKKSQNGFITPLLIAVIALLAIAGGYYVYSKNFMNVLSKQNNNPQFVNIDNKNLQVAVSSSSSVEFKAEDKTNSNIESAATQMISTSTFSGWVVYVDPVGKPVVGCFQTERIQHRVIQSMTFSF